MSTTYPGILVFAVLIVFIYMLAGRLVANHTGEQKLFSTPFHCLLIGMGLWYIWALLTSITIGIPFLTSFILFFLCSLILAFGMFRVFQTTREVEHFWTKIITSCLLLAPLLWWATGDATIQWDEFTHYMKNASHLVQLEKIYGAADIERFAINHPYLPLAATLSVLPASLFTGALIQSLPAVFNIILLAGVAGGLVHTAGVPVRWSNLPLVTAGSVLGVTLLNPFFDTNILLSAYPDVPFAIVLFGVVFPFFFKRALPTGWGVLPTAIVLSLLVGIKEVAIYLYVFIVALWLIRNLLEKPKYCPSLIFGWIVLIALPLISWLLWQNYILGLHVDVVYGTGAKNTVHWGQLAEVLTTMGRILMHKMAATAVIIVALVLTLKNMSTDLQKGDLVTMMRHTLIDRAWLAIPSLLFVYYSGVLVITYMSHFNGPVTHDAQLYGFALVHLQFVFLLPLWMWFRKFYDQSQIREISFRMPWLIGLGLSAFVVVMQFAQQNRFNSEPIAPIKHTLLAAQSMRNLPIPSNPYVRWGSPVASLDNKDYTNDLYSYVLGFGLRDYTIVEPAYNLAKQLNFDRDKFHQVLYEQGFRHLWIHSPDDDVRTKLIGKSLRSDHSYLFAVTETGFRKQVAFPHKGYDRPYLK